MQLTQSLRKMLVLGVTGAVVVTGTAFAEEVVGSDPVEAPAVEAPAEEPVEAPAEDPVEAPAEEPVVGETVEEVVETPSTEDVTELADDTAPVADEAVHPDNHGALVSEAAHSPTPEGFRNHGEYVSGVARGEHGPQVESTDEADATESTESTEDADTATTQAAGPGKSAGKGKNK